MSITAVAVTVIGLGFDDDCINEAIDSLTTTTNVRGCDHPETDKPFCSQCGEPTWVEEDDRMEVYDFLELLREKAPEGIEIESCSPSVGGIYIGWCLKAGRYEPEICEDIPDVEKIAEQLKALLEPFSMWNENSELQVWTHLYLS